MGDVPTAHPLSWPQGWQRTAPSARAATRFHTSRDSGRGWKSKEGLTLAQARARLQEELARLGAKDVILSTNIRLRLDGLPRSGEPAPADPGAAVYFSLKKRPTVLACDRWTTVAGNVAAIAAHIDALRGMDRWGVGSLERAFTGYAALTAPMSPDDWRALLGDCSTLEEAEASYRRQAREAHPDTPSGSTSRMAALNAAIALARKEKRDG